MLANLSNTLRRLSSRTWLIFASLAVEVVFFSFVAPWMQAQLPTSPLDLKFFYAPEEAFSLVESYGEAGRATYIIFDLTADFIHPIAYTLFFCLLLSVVFQRGFPSGSKIQQLNVVPVITWAFDMLENIGVVTLLSVYPATPTGVAWFTALSTSLKWTLFMATVLLMLYGFVKAAMNGFKKQA